jgi:hypothetical protein
MRLPGEGAATREHLPAINRELIAADRDDLVIFNPADMLDIPDTATLMGEAINFASRFRMLGASAIDLLEMRDLPRFKTIEQYTEAVQSGRHPGMNLYNHAGHPAFTRMLIVEPGSIIRLTMDITNMPSGLTYAFFQDELLAAYKQMRQMVDKADVSVLKMSSNSVDMRYLIGN